MSYGKNTNTFNSKQYKQVEKEINVYKKQLEESNPPFNSSPPGRIPEHSAPQNSAAGKGS